MLEEIENMYEPTSYEYKAGCFVDYITPEICKHIQIIYNEKILQNDNGGRLDQRIDRRLDRIQFLLEEGNLTQKESNEKVVEELENLHSKVDKVQDTVTHIKKNDDGHAVETSLY